MTAPDDVASGADPAAVVLSVEEAVRRSTPQDAAFTEVTGLQRLGFSIFVALLVTSGVLFAALMTFAATTYPELSQVTGLVAENGDKLASWQAAQDDWRTSVKDLGTTFLVTPVLPLLGIVIGYIFGERARAERGQGEA